MFSLDFKRQVEWCLVKFSAHLRFCVENQTGAERVGDHLSLASPMIYEISSLCFIKNWI